MAEVIDRPKTRAQEQPELMQAGNHEALVNGDVTVTASPYRNISAEPHNERHSFFGADGITSGYELQTEYLPIDLASNPEELTVKVTFRANGNYADPYRICDSGYCEVFEQMDRSQILGAMAIEREIALADFLELKDRLTSIEAYSFEYDDAESKVNVGRAFSQLFRSAALSENLGELLNSTPLGDMTVRQY